MSGSVEPLISVVVPVFNAAATLRRTLDSALAQSHARLEILVIDDASSDGSRVIIEEHAALDARVRPILLPRNGGVAGARNAGLDAATGEYIAFLDSDDGWRPDKIERQLATLQQTGAAICYTVFERVATDGRLLSLVCPPAQLTHADLLRSNHIALSTALYRRSGSAPRFRRVGHEDYVFWLDFLRDGGRAVRVADPEPLAWYLVREGSLSSNKLRAARWQWRIYRDIERIGPVGSTWLMGQYLHHAIRKRRQR